METSIKRVASVVFSLVLAFSLIPSPLYAEAEPNTDAASSQENQTQNDQNGSSVSTTDQ